MPHELTTLYRRLQHAWEVLGPVDPEPIVRNILHDHMPTRVEDTALEAALFAYWTTLCQEGGDDDYAV